MLKLSFASHVETQFRVFSKPLAHLNQHLEGCLEGGIDVQVVGETNPASITIAGEYSTHDGCCLLLQYLIQSCASGGRRIVEDMCYEIRRAEACVD
jgi:hypothetical protein